MKRLGAIIALTLIMIMATSSLAFAADFAVSSTSPKQGATGQSIDNMGVKVTFNEPVYNEKNIKANSKLCHIYEKESGKEVPSKVAFNSKEKDLLLVVADTSADAKEQAVIKNETEYLMVIEDGFLSADGDNLGRYELSFTTLNQKTSIIVSVVMMVVMFGGMLFFTVREGRKKQAETKKGGKDSQKGEAVNPYKEAKRTGKSVEEIVERERKKKAKESERADKDAKAYAEKQAKEAAKAEKAAAEKSNIKVVSAPAPISEAGSTYVHPSGKNKKKKK